MTKTLKILCTAMFITLLLGGTSFATSMSDTYYFYYQENGVDTTVEWAELSFKASDGDGWWYEYNLSVVNSMGDSHAVHDLILPIIAGGYDSLSLPDGTSLDSFYAGDPDVLAFYFGDDGLVTGDTSGIIRFHSDYSPKVGFATIINGDSSTNYEAKAAIGGIGGGGGTDNRVPEPATLVLVGFGLIGVTAFKHLRSIRQ